MDFLLSGNKRLREVRVLSIADFEHFSNLFESSRHALYRFDTSSRVATVWFSFRGLDP